MVESRKLAAILAADVVGFSRLAGMDEDRTLARLRALRSDLIDPTIAVHNGHVVKRTGDGASSSSAAWSMPCAAPSRCRTRWSTATLAYRRIAVLNSGRCDDLNAASKRAAARFGFHVRGSVPPAHDHQRPQPRHRLVLDVGFEWPARRAAFERWLDPANFDAEGRQKVSLTSLNAG